MEPIEAYNAALDRRHALQRQARNAGISEEYIDLLVESFYKKVRAHPELGPVFNEVIQDRWPEHLAKMKLFWTSVALRTGDYKGSPVPVHRALTNATADHFPTWLFLFYQTLEETAPSPEAAKIFQTFAQSIAARLQQVMFSKN